ncbi:MAG TPA: AarF/ABC1/UbiB kinase family protein [Planctomycetaceae bacterium]|nr:AarF/ABC1/UbiB kinase family protein [Planctomycetaceae bacterium]
MRISSIPHIYRHVNRWREILAVFSKYGLADWISRLGPDFAKDLLKAPGGTAIARHSWQTRIRLAISELGPTFIKLGQILSTRPDLVGVALAEELQHLQADVPADPPEVVRAIIVAELGRPVEELFDQFDETPFASASIGQCHGARLKTGEAVVVRVQHADIQRKVAVDCDILQGLAQMAERIPEFRNYRPRAIASEFERTIRRELDFSRERRHMELFARNFAGDPRVHIPRAYGELCTSRVLCMERVEGIPLADVDRLRSAGVDLEQIGRRGAEIYLKMVFEHGFFHADPHPGNILVMDGGVIALLDHGMVGRIDERLHEDMAEMLLAVTTQDAEHLTSLIVRVGQIPAELDRTALSIDVTDLVAHYGNQPIEEFDLSGALRELVELIRRYRIMLPTRIAMLIKTLITLEGTSRLLSPHFSLLELIKPYRRKMLMRRFSPRRRARKLRRFLADMEHLIETLPQGIQDILEQVQSGTFDVHLDHRGLEPSVNRLVLGMLASALFLGSSWLLAQHVPPLFRGVSVPGTTGCVLALLLGLRLLRAINKSGHLDRGSDRREDRN